MAGGWSTDDGVQKQIDSTVEDGLERVRSRIPKGESRRDCAECGEPIPEARRKALPGVKLCVACQEDLDEAETKSFSGYNRRGSKDSQLR
ncbi:DksA/TraR family C4-type zinc finger protein [Wenzhouxiangella sp. EGI_FJ10305]|uniref:DksA/TraR family C4-type zinc finger protein n=1 Tax=Wenzhouxiangella sp. EGI_FJ10305 TaxID=3243768 RepID=UPI0035D8B4E5